MKDDKEDDRERRAIVAVVAVLIAVVIFVLVRIFQNGPWSSPRDTLNEFFRQLPYAWILGGLLAFGLVAGIVYLIRRGK